MSATMEAQSSPMEPATTTSSGGQAAASSSSTSNQQQQPLRLLVRMNSSSSSNSTTKVIMAPSTSNSVSTTTAAAATASANNKRHTLGYRLRRLIFPPFRPMRDASSTNVHSAKDVEAGYNKNCLKHNTSIHSSSSLESENSAGTHSQSTSSSKKRKRTRHQEQQTDSNNRSTENVSAVLLQPFPAGGSTENDDNGATFECPICLLEQALSSYPELSTCNHRACSTCMYQYLRVEICESRVNITCPQCSEKIHPNDIAKILSDNSILVDKYETFMLRRILITDPDARWCPAPDCTYCVIATGCASCPKLTCERPGCGTFFCYHCKQEWHANQTCDEAKQTRNRKAGTSGAGTPGTSKSVVTFGGASTSGKKSDFSRASTSVDSSLLKRDDLKPCPCCKVLIIKMDDGSCNHMTCSVCGTEFCWLCMQKISDLHYLSPSGCTFWGKKPWSRKKKIMWQLGMLVGAPIGIALIAGIAVPAIIIGIPVWVGRKMYARFERNRLSRPKSNLLVTAGVLTAIFVSPILAAVAVGIGVPILLAYVYGVVPFSLCRSGGCGITTSSSGVKIDLDEEEVATNGPADGVSLDTALSGTNRVIGNPSIGEVSLGLSTSLSIGSNNHLDDRVVLDIQPDVEDSSIQGCAGSISSALLVNGQTQTEGATSVTMASTSGGFIQASNLINNNNNGSNKLETPVEVNKRYSFSSQTADTTSVSLSFGENRSLRTNLSGEDEGGSLKGHPGSIRAGITGEALISSPVEVNVIIKDQVSPKDTNAGNEPTNTAPATTVNLFNRFESRSLEYISCNYCNICQKSHKPCCPNFKHPGKNSKLELATATTVAPTSPPPPPPQPLPSSSSTQISKKLVDEKGDTNDNNNTVKEDDKLDIENNNFVQDGDHNRYLAHKLEKGDNISRSIIATAGSLGKASSQIIYPNTSGIGIGGDSNDSINNQANPRTSRPSLSHSLNFIEARK